MPVTFLRVTMNSLGKFNIPNQYPERGLYDSEANLRYTVLSIGIGL